VTDEYPEMPSRAQLPWRIPQGSRMSKTSVKSKNRPVS
jgi:hypothetical protein